MLTHFNLLHIFVYFFDILGAHEGILLISDVKIDPSVIFGDLALDVDILLQGIVSLVEDFASNRSAESARLVNKWVIWV